MEVELKFQVPLARRAALRRAVATPTVQRTRLQAVYADTADDRLSAAGLALRLRKEGRLWVQTLKGRGDGLMQRLEHEVPLPAQHGEPLLDPARHAGTAVGELLQRVLQTDAPASAALLPVYRTDIQRLHRSVSQGGARIELALDEGWILAGGQRLAVFEIEFELKSGSPAALVALAQRWVQRFGLVWDVRTKSERGFRLARGLQQVPAVRAPAVSWPVARPAAGSAASGKAGRKNTRQGDKQGAARRAPGAAAQGPDTAQAWSALLLSALGQVLPNAAELACTQAPASQAPTDPAAALAMARHLHQLRVGLRRLRSVLGPCADWSPDPAAARALQAAWREPFTQLGAARDQDVLGGGLWPEIQAAGGPPAAASAAVPLALPGPAELLRRPAFTQLLLQSLALSLPLEAAARLRAGEPTRAPTEPGTATPVDEAPRLPVAARALLRRAWRPVRRSASAFSSLPLEEQHRTRRRLKRLRYLLEGLLALPGDLSWPRAALRRWHRRLCRALDALGRYNDLCMADEALVRATAQVSAMAAPADAGAWFARGWLAVQRPLAMAEAAQRLQRLVHTPVPWSKPR